MGQMILSSVKTGLADIFQQFSLLIVSSIFHANRTFETIENYLQSAILYSISDQ